MRDRPPLSAQVCALLISLAGLLGAGCISRQEGCLDPGAANYDLEAERGCPACCTYPVVSIEWSPKWAGMNFNLADTFYDIAGRPYLIKDLRFLLECWQWADFSGEIYTVDTTRVTCGGSSLALPADFNLIAPNQFQYTLGRVREFPEAEAIRFSIGPARDYSCADDGDFAVPVFLTDEGPLWDASSGSLGAGRVVIQADPLDPKTDTLYLHDAIILEIPYRYSFARGLAARFRLTADYAKWFAAADLTNLSTFAASWQAGIPGSVIRTP